MARTKVAFQNCFPYHVTARCHNREWFRLPMPEVWQVMGEQLYFIQRAYGIRVIAFVLMNNHYHLLIQTPGANLDRAMQWFQRETGRTLNRLSGRVNQAYGGRYFRSMVDSDLYFCHVYKYVYLNPTEAGMVDQILDYPYSSLPALLGLRPLPFAVHDELLPGAVEETLNWLQRIPERKNWDAVRSGLRRRVFRLRHVDKKPHPLETEML